MTPEQMARELYDELYVREDMDDSHQQWCATTIADVIRTAIAAEREGIAGALAIEANRLAAMAAPGAYPDRRELQDYAAMVLRSEAARVRRGA